MQILIRVFLLSLALFFAGMTMSVGQAQTEPSATPQVVIKKRQLLVQPRDANGNIIATPFMEDPVLWARNQQQNFYGSMSTSLHQLKAGSSMATAWMLLLLGFGYGVFHAAGPGHGKVIISSWLLATENDLRRGLLVAFFSSMFQALIAIALVSVLLLLVASVGGVVRNITDVLESASYAMISAVGLYLMWTALRGWFKHRSKNSFEIVARHEDYHGHAGHVHDEHCGHSHAPTAIDVRGDWSLSKALSLSFAIGLRPCTGAILVLLSANALGLYWAGIASTLAMGVGVFLTVAIIATITVYGKDLALKLARGDNQRLAFIVNIMKLGGGSVVAFFGAIMFLGSLGRVNGMM
jgi:nickel/cobalt transporter (NicO) family protein